jgi:hypothetical protein
MSNEEFLNKYEQLQADGTLNEMYRRGLVPYKSIYYYDIYKYINRTNLSLRKAALFFNVSTYPIRAAIRAFRS